MNFDFCSDLHLEFDGESSRVLEHFPLQRSPVLILAGDIVEVALLTGAANPRQAQTVRFFDWVTENYKTVLYVLGNHEHYQLELNRSLVVLREFLQARGLQNIHVLENDVIELDDVLVFGTTLWTSCNKGNPVVMNAVHRAMADYRTIGYQNERGERIRLTPEFTMDVHAAAMVALHAFLQQPTHKKRVVITHHAPHIASVEPYYRTHSATPAFYEELFDLIQDSAIHTWIHGHTHSPSDYPIGNTRILANPRGYHGLEVTGDFRVKPVVV